ncbi:NADH-quinone oxidoreductase subunit J [Thalassomonas actiniarum]|uniref:NADH-quinone oxidoreductase subunit J n=1 Tax=Thalassomonas actiniarum TaxID=485447 RepID=A0AAE9YWS5_9GAMM|nr:NADH-quinone oxidoreductase subunit J [Thalassomonas actiniarum]
MELMFYLAGAVAVLASLKVVTGKNTIHALLYLVVSLLAVAVCFYLMGAPFAAGLEVIVYAGAILVLFVFSVMLFNLNHDEVLFARQSQGLGFWAGPVVLAMCLLALLVNIIQSADIQDKLTVNLVDAKQVGILLYGPYLLAVEIASFLLLAGLIAGYHYARPEGPGSHGGRS